MITRIGRKNYSIWTFDLESHNDEESIKKMETSMWLGCFINEDSKIDDENSYLYNMSDFLDRLEELSRPGHKHNEKKKCCNLCIYIYNLSFEWSFILPELIKRGFVFGNIKGADKPSYNSVSTKSVSSVWEARITFGGKHGEIIFRDLGKIYQGGLANVAKAFNLETQKGEIDYRLNRLHGWIPTKEEKEYCFKDTRILIEILQKQLEKGDKDFWKSSSAAGYAMRKLISEGYKNEKSPYKKFRQDYPYLSKEENEFLRNSVSGGITYAPSRWQFKDIKQKILHIDAHQMHPSQAYEHYFPYGKGDYFTGKPPFGGISCCRIKVSYDDVKLFSIIQLIGIDAIENKEITVWDFEIPTMKKCFINLKIEYIDGYTYRAKKLPWREFYANNYKSRLIAKKNKDAFGTFYYKLLNNSSYGKLLEKPHNEIFENIINEEGIIDSNIEEKAEEDLKNESKYTYLPVGSCIPAYSRVDLLETALKFNWKNVCYFDTDSIFVLYDEDSKRVWENEINKTDFLGGWGLEEIADRGQFTAPKRYKLYSNNETIIKAGGINFKAYIEERAQKLNIDADKYQVSYDEINIVSSSWKVQRAYRCKGGTIIEFQNKEMNIQKKYENIYFNNIAC